MAVTFLTNEDKVLRYDAQELTEEQKAQARANIGVDASIEGGGSGLSENAKTLLLTILRNGVYVSDQSANIAALEQVLKETAGDDTGGDTGGDSGDTGGGDTGGEDTGGDTEWTLVRDLSNDIVYGYGINNTYDATIGGYMKVNTGRAGYFAFDVPLEYGYIYLFDWECAVETANLAFTLYNTNALVEVNSQSNISASNIRDNYGWNTDRGRTLTVPEDINGYPPAAVRFSLRADTSNSAVTEGMITRFRVYRKAVG